MSGLNSIDLFGWEVPTAVFTAIVSLVASGLGALIALAVNRISNRQQNERQKLQLSHDAEQKAIERRLKAKTEIFLQAAEQLAKGARYLIRYHELNLPPSEHAAIIADYDAASARIHLVGGLETIRALTEANECFQIQSLRLNKMRLPLQRRAGQLRVIEAQLSEDIQSRKSVEGRFEQIYRTNQANPELPQLSEQFKFLQERIATAQGERTTIGREVYEGSLDLFGECRKAVRAYTDRLRRVNLVAREELALSFDVAAQEYMDIMQRTNDRVDAEMEELVAVLLASNKHVESK